MTFARGATAKDRLELDWRHPVPPERGPGTSAQLVLPLDEALAVLWGDDTRPLLVLRECRKCKGTDLPLLHQAMNNERTQLLTNWFRVVRLPAHVVDGSHPFHAVFAGLDSGAQSPHFFLLAHPKAKPIGFTGTQTQQQLWRAMHEVVRERYQLDPVAALKKWQTLLDQFDVIEARQQRWCEQLRETRASQGPNSARARKLEQRLDAAEVEMEHLLGREKRVRNLVLLPFPK